MAEFMLFMRRHGGKDLVSKVTEYLMADANAAVLPLRADSRQAVEARGQFYIGKLAPFES